MMDNEKIKEEGVKLAQLVLDELGIGFFPPGDLRHDWDDQLIIQAHILLAVAEDELESALGEQEGE